MATSSFDLHIPAVRTAATRAVQYCPVTGRRPQLADRADAVAEGIAAAFAAFDEDDTLTQAQLAWLAIKHAELYLAALARRMRREVPVGIH
jgi:hypothetical protein